MGVPEVVLVYLGAFVLLQLLVYRHLRGKDGDAGRPWGGSADGDGGSGRERRTTPDGPGTRERSGPPDSDRTRGRDETVTRMERLRSRGGGSERRCPDCGASNEPGYTFCRDCASRLPG